MTAAATLSSERMDYETPPWFLDMVRLVGPIVCDPSTSVKNPTGAQIFYAPPTLNAVVDGLRGRYAGPCGLRGIWPRLGLTYVNPQYGAFLSGPVDPDRKVYRTDKATKAKILTGTGTGWGQRIAAHPGEVLTLVPARTGSGWFRHLFERSHLRLDWNPGRIAFVIPETGETAGQPAHDSTVFYSGPNALRFAEVFGPRGILIRGGRPWL